ncbi:ADP-ribosyltransferase [Micromonospora haikouensis]|uniref:ADP-ribosyltransferase n=1 Tax=Micromonospora haikouensis TaxID=686309 RepID=UPI003D73589D
MTASHAPRALLVARYAVKGFREELHPRDGHGRFARKPGAGLARVGLSDGGGRPPARPAAPGSPGMRDARRFTSDEDAVAWADEYLEPPVLEEDEVDAVLDYTGDYYEDINGALRALDDTGEEPDVWTQDRIDAVRSAISQSSAPEPFVVFRGSPPRILESMIGELGEPDDDVRVQQLVGRTFHVPTFHSTSIGAKSYFEYSPVQWMIKIPEGQNCLWLEGDLTQTSGEREVLLPDNTRRVIHAVYRNPVDPADKRWYVEAEVVPNDWKPGPDWVPQPFGDAYVGYLGRSRSSAAT